MSNKQPNPSDVIIGNNIRRLRTSQGMSQEKLGEILGITFQQIQKYEKGTNRVSGSKLDMLCSALRCSLLDIFAGTAAAGGAASAAPTLSVHAMRLATAFDRIRGAQTRQAISRVVMAIIAEQEQDEPEQAGDAEPARDIAA